VTTIILAIGFSVLASSTFLINSQMGLMTAISIIIALIFDFTLLPVLLLIGSRKADNQPERIEYAHQDVEMV
ncbi:MAG: MMPL family transporter, partial [Verrucomicrobiota bacterium]